MTARVLMLGAVHLIMTARVLMPGAVHLIMAARVLMLGAVHLTMTARVFSRRPNAGPGPLSSTATAPSG